MAQILFTLLLVAINFIVLWKAIAPFSSNSDASSASDLTQKHEFSYIGSDFPTHLPFTPPSIHLKFSDSPRYTVQQPFSLQVWGSSSPPSWGFVRLGPQKRAFEISLFHQLHCLDVLARAFTSVDGKVRDDNHLSHCLGYLRHMLLCESDGTLEPGDFMDGLYEGQGEEFQERLEYTRECRDWSAVFDFDERNYLEFHEFRANEELGNKMVVTEEAAHDDIHL